MLLVVYVISVISLFCVLVSGSSQSFSNNTLEEFKTYLDENFLPIFMNHKNLPESAFNITEDLFSILSAQGPRSFTEMKVLTLEAFIDSFKRFVLDGGMSPYEADFLYSVVNDCCDQFHISCLSSGSSPSTSIEEVENNWIKIQNENIKNYMSAFNAYSVSSSSDGMNVNDVRQYQISSVSRSNFWTDLIQTLKGSESNINKSIINIFKKCFKDDLSSYCPKLTLIDSICSQFEREQIYHKTTYGCSFMAGTIIHNEILKLFPDLVSSSSPFTAFKSEIAAIFNDLIMFTEMKWNNNNTLPTRTAVAAPLKSQNFLSQEFRKFYLETFLSLTNSLLDSWTTVSEDFGLFEYEDKLTRTIFSNRLSLFIKLVNDQVNTDFMQAVNYRVEFSYLKSALHQTVEQIIRSKLQLDVLQKNFYGIVEIFTGFLRENYQDKFFSKSENDIIKEQQELKEDTLAAVKKAESQPQPQPKEEQEQQQEEEPESPKEIIFNPDEIIDNPTIISDLFKQNLTSSKDLPIFEDLLCSVMEEYDSFVDQNFTDSTPEMKDSLKELLNGAILSSYSSLQ